MGEASMRPALLLVPLLLAAAAVPAAEADTLCPRGQPTAGVDCHDKLLRPGRDHLVLLARAAGGDAHAALREPLADGDDADGEPPAEAGYARYADDEAGEEVVLVLLACGDVAAAGLCVPTSHFAGGHFAPLGQDARVWTDAEWRSAGASADLAAAGHEARLQTGTFHFWGLQYGYVEAWVDGTQVVGFFDAMPLP